MVELIYEDFQPVNIVKSPAFLNYCKILNPFYHPALHTHFLCVAISRKYKKIKEMVMMSVHKAEYVPLLQICGQDVIVEHICLLLYYLFPDDMLIYHHCVTTREVSVSHNTENLANEIEEVLIKQMGY